ncbi:MAG: hypothetical protein CM1200mP22_32010 [Dehalococcoidia bacterium]|nr:MAG: hypothetical protein CM1200mP22_32010 [Dehalococcoidia bacterium]
MELAMIGRKEETGQPMENNVVVAGIGALETWSTFGR